MGGFFYGKGVLKMISERIGIHVRRVKLVEIEDQLRELNQSFPGQRKLPYFERDIEYRTLREKLLDQKRLLAREQMDLKKEVRGSQRFFEQRKQRRR